MQIIEVTDMGVRSAVITLRRTGTPLRFTLYPMIHLGRREFYAEVRARASRCALIVTEGHRRPGPRVSLPALAYRMLRRHRRSRLVIQDVGEDTLGVEVLRPDLTLPEVRERLRRLPLLTYATAWLTLWVVLPWVVLFLLIFGARRFLAHELALDVDTMHTDPPLGPRWDAIDQVIVDDRDALLLDALSDIHRQRCAQPIEVAVIYGAAHMPAVIYGLLARHGYRARTAEWVTVFDLDD